MPRKKKQDVNLDELDFKSILEESVLCSTLGRTMASFGSTLTGREKLNANLIYLLLKADKELPSRTPATARISKETKSKKYTYPQVIKWFANKYPKEAQPLLAKLKESYDSVETSVLYGVVEGKNLPDEYHVNVLVELLNIPRQDAAVMYYGAIKPHIERLEEKEGLAKIVMRES